MQETVILPWRGSSCRSQRLPDLLERARVFDRRQIAGIATLGERLDRAPQELARACLRQQRDEMHCARPSDSAELAVYSIHHLAAHRRDSFGSCDFRRVLDHRKRDRDLALELIGHADDRDRSIVHAIDGVTAGDARKRNVRRRRGRNGRQGAGSCRKPLFYRGAVPHVARSA